MVAAAGQTVFPFNFRCDVSATLFVSKNAIAQGGFTVALNADQTAAPGGSITLAVGALLADVVKVQRITPQTQSAAFSQYGAFSSASLMAVLDSLVMMIQELSVLANAAGGIVPPTNGIENDVPAGLVNSTDGTDGNGSFTFSHAPAVGFDAFFNVLLDGVRQPPGRYAKVPGSPTIQFGAGFHPIAGSDIRGDYFF